MTTPVKIVILGGGTSGWMAAAQLSQLLRTGRHSVTLVESDAIATVGVGEATLPHLKDFHDNLGIDEADFMRRTGATFKLGIRFRDWGAEGHDYIHPFGAYGQAWGGIAFHQHWQRAKSAGAAVAPLEAHNFAITAARAGRFDFPTGDAQSVKATYAYAYHIDATLYAGFLRDVATARGVIRRQGTVVAVERDATGGVRALRLPSGETIAGDLFIDASGFAGLLIGKTPGAGWEDWTPWLPCDRAWAVPTPRTDDVPPYTTSTAREAGWQWRIPLQHRTGNGYVFASAFLAEDEARDALLARLDGPPMAEPRLLRFSAGRRTAAWLRNCVAVGLAGGFLEPLESTSLYLVQAAVQRLTTLLAVPPDARLVREFNRQMDVEYERIRDFLILHYHANTRGEALWRHVCATAIPDSLAHKLDLFRTRGHIPHYRDGLFSPPSWLAVLTGQGVAAQGHDPLAEAVPLAALTERMADLARTIASHVEAMPDHAARISTFAPARTGARS